MRQLLQVIALKENIRPDHELFSMSILHLYHFLTCNIRNLNSLHAAYHRIILYFP